MRLAAAVAGMLVVLCATGVADAAAPPTARQPPTHGIAAGAGTVVATSESQPFWPIPGTGEPFPTPPGHEAGWPPGTEYRFSFFAIGALDLSGARGTLTLSRPGHWRIEGRIRCAEGQPETGFRALFGSITREEGPTPPLDGDFILFIEPDGLSFLPGALQGPDPCLVFGHPPILRTDLLRGSIFTRAF
jgi:hypothetical protein